MAASDFTKIGKAGDDISLIALEVASGQLKATLTKADGTSIESGEVSVGGDVPDASTTEAGIVQLAAGSGTSESLVMHQKAVTDYVTAQIQAAITTALNANY